MVPLGRLEQYQNGMASIEKQHWTLLLSSDENESESTNAGGQK
jgi:hypothetical protein